MEKGRILGGLAVMLGLVVIGLMLPEAVSRYRSYDRTVNVKGLCEKEVKADKVIWPVVYKVMANDIQSVYDQTDRNNAAIIGFLKAGGIEPSEMTVSVPEISDKYAVEYGSNDRAFRYIAKTVITVCTSDVDKVLELMSKQSELLKKGILKSPIKILCIQLKSSGITKRQRNRPIRKDTPPPSIKRNR